jgi:RimJ/RimL family protein N-acetyltransferase
MRQIETARGSVIVRQTDESDAVALRQLRIEALTAHPTSFGASPENVDERNWATLAKGGTGDAVFVATAGDALIAMTGVYRGKGSKDRHRVGIWGVYVRPEWRGLHIAEAMLELAAEWAAERGIKIVHLMACTHNAPAIACYHRCGFRVSGVEYATIEVDGRYYDEFLMYRWLDDKQ